MNGDSVTWMGPEETGQVFKVYHVETEAHDIVLAEGAPTETYVDYLGRKAFDNYAEYVGLYGEERCVHESAYPRISSARCLPDALKARVGRRQAA